jgi:palmitoyl transferase
MMKLISLRLCAFTLFALLADTSQAQSTLNMDDRAAVTAAVDAPPNGMFDWVKDDADKVEKTFERIYDDGRLSMILSGYAHHGRSTYTREQLDELNEKAWGFGFSKEMRDEKDNEESISFLVIADSHYTPQITAGYAYQWEKELGGGLEVGIGYTAGLISRTDIINGIPFPGILPLATFGTRDTKLVASYIPRLSGQGNGDVLYLALRIALK